MLDETNLFSSYSNKTRIVLLSGNVVWKLWDKVG